MALVLVEKTAGIATVTLNRPDAKNALSAELMVELTETIKSLGQDQETRVIILAGAGDSFCAGGDLNGMRRAREEGNIAMQATVNLYAELVLAVTRSVRPVIAAVHGYALAGGVGLSAACDITLAADNARFGLPEINVGIWAAVASVPIYRLIGPKHTAELLFTGRRFDAAEAFRLGLVNHVVPAADLYGRARTLAAEIAGKSPLAVRLGREALQMVRDLEYEAAIRHVREVITVLSGSADAAEGLAAFAEKRAPVWKGR